VLTEVFDYISVNSFIGSSFYTLKNMKLKLMLLFAVACCLATVEVRAQAYAITNARIVTVSGPTIENGTVVLRDGLIDAVGASLVPPADVTVIDGSGMTVYPGFIDALTSLGLQAPQTPGQQRGGGPQVQQQQTAAWSNSNYPAGLRAEDTVVDDIRAGEAQFEAARGAGFTTVLTVGRTGIFNGRSAVIDLAGESISAMIVRSPFAEHFTFTTIGGGQYPASLLGTFAALRQMLLDAQRLQKLQKQYDANPRGMRRPEPDRSLEALFPIINRQMPLVFNANSENEITRSLDLAKEFNIRAIIAGGTEAWKLADRLKSQDVPVLLSLNFPRRTASSSPDADPESMDVLRMRAEAPKGAARLAQAGVKFAFQSGGAASLTDFFMNAAKAVENGLSRDAAIRAMTLGSAEILGVDDRLGSIEKGKIANIALVRGDVFGRDRFVSRVFIDGKLFEMKEPPARREGPIRGGTTSAPAVATVAGNFTINVDIPGQPLTGTLALIQQGPILTGSLTTSLGVMPIKDGKVTAEGFSFSGTVEFGGAQLDIVVRGSVSGTQISGTIDTPQGSVPFTGTRNP
jgi:imidazolonepropionase-like amidohydrolase